MRRGLGVTAAILLLAGCDGSSVEPPLIQGTGTVEGVVYLDFDASGTLSGLDQPVDGAIVRAILPGSGEVLGTDTTGADGAFLMEEVAVGSIQVEVAPASLGDTLLAVPLDSARYTLPAGSTLAIALGVTYPELTLPEVRGADPGIPVFTRGVVLNSRGQAPGGAVHVEGGGVAIRILAPPSVQVLQGDSVRIGGRVDTDLGQPVLVDPRVLRVEPLARDLVPRTPTMGAAASGANGLDAAFVEFTSGTVVGQVTVSEGFHVTVTDGADTLLVRLRTAQGFFQSGIPAGAEIISLKGLLVADPDTGTWGLVPRTTQDVVLRAP